LDVLAGSKTSWLESWNLESWNPVFLTEILPRLLESFIVRPLYSKKVIPILAGIFGFKSNSLARFFYSEMIS